MTRSTRTFIASFLVLFLEVALIRWMPAYIRLLKFIGMGKQIRVEGP